MAMGARTFGVDNPGTVEQFRTGTGQLNSAPLVGPVVINEVMFYPPSIDGTNDNTQDEYVELLNISSATVNLFDPGAPTNTWKLKGGIDYVFPQNVSIPAGGYVLVVNFDPVVDQPALTEFRNRYGVNANVPLYGPYGGHLSNSGENLALYKPDPPQIAPHPDAGFVPYVLVERVEYGSTAPWPNGAAGTGSSLLRQAAFSYGNEPANWFVGAPTAGKVNAANPGDTDGDGLPDSWEIQYFGSINDPRAVAGADPDNDGFTNLQEFYAGTSPTDPNSYLKLESVNISSGSATLHFNAVAGKTYSILYRTELANGTWLTLTNIDAQASSGPIGINDPGFGPTGGRFYRLVTPRLP